MRNPAFVVLTFLITLAPAGALAGQNRLATAPSMGLAKSSPVRFENPLDARVGLIVEGVPLSKAMDVLRRTSPVPIIFSPTLIPEVDVTCNCADVSLGEALSRILVGTRLEFVDRAGQVVVRIQRGDPSR